MKQKKTIAIHDIDLSALHFQQICMNFFPCEYADYVVKSRSTVVCNSHDSEHVGYSILSLVVMIEGIVR